MRAGHTCQFGWPAPVALMTEMPKSWPPGMTRFHVSQEGLQGRGRGRTCHLPLRLAFPRARLGAAASAAASGAPCCWASHSCWKRGRTSGSRSSRSSLGSSVSISATCSTQRRCDTDTAARAGSRLLCPSSMFWEAKMILEHSRALWKQQ